jgi:hypothetical protein
LASDHRLIVLLHHADPTVASIQLPSPFKFEAPSPSEGIRYVARLEKAKGWAGVPPLASAAASDMATEEFALRTWFRHLFGDPALFSSTPGKQRVVWVSAELDSAATEDFSTVQERLSMMRLFKEGNIDLAAGYAWEGPLDHPRSSGGVWMGPVGGGADFALEEAEVPQLQHFLDTHKKPDMPAELRVAASLLDSSYWTAAPGLALLTACVGLEVVLNPSQGEVTHRLARNVAALLSETRADFCNTRDEIKHLYNIRSGYAHSGSKKAVQPADAIRAREYLRRVIRSAWDHWPGWKGLIEELDYKGFPPG